MVSHAVAVITSLTSPLSQAAAFCLPRFPFESDSRVVLANTKRLRQALRTRRTPIWLAWSLLAMSLASPIKHKVKVQGRQVIGISDCHVLTPTRSFI